MLATEVAFCRGATCSVRHQYQPNLGLLPHPPGTLVRGQYLIYIRALRATLNKTDRSFNSVSLYQSASYMSFVIPAWLKSNSYISYYRLSLLYIFYKLNPIIYNSDLVNRGTSTAKGTRKPVQLECYFAEDITVVCEISSTVCTDAMRLTTPHQIYKIPYIALLPYQYSSTFYKSRPIL